MSQQRFGWPAPAPVIVEDVTDDVLARAPDVHRPVWTSLSMGSGTMEQATSPMWLTPFVKQCFVVVGASVNMSQIGMVLGLAAVLLPQLRAPGSAVAIDDSVGSWIASLPAFGLIVGNVTVPTLMGKLGRKKANIISIMIVILGWSCLVLTTDLVLILVARALQGVSVGMSSCLIPIVIGEYTSPRNRGAFSIVMSLIMAAGTLTVHTLGSFVSWKTTALICTLISFVDLIMVAFSPETPSWLAAQGNYAECRRNFRWLRGTEEEAELTKMIEVNKVYVGSQVEQNFTKKIKSFFKLLHKKEFYKPIIIMVHLYAMGQWAGVNILAPFVVTLVDMIVGANKENTAAVVISLGIQRMISCVCAVFIIRKLKRRTMLFIFVGVNAVVLLATAGYIYAKDHLGIYNHPIIGGILLHLLMVTVAIASLPLPYVIAGEIFPLRYRSISGGISSVFCSINIFLCVKTFPYIVERLGLDGAYCMYAAIVVYCLVVVWFLMPETKDRTLLEIEGEFSAVVPPLDDEELKSAQPLTIVNDCE